MNKHIIFLLAALLFLQLHLVQAQVKDSPPGRVIPIVPKRLSSDTVLNDSLVKKRKADSLAKIKENRKKSLIIDSTKNKKRIDSLARVTNSKLRDSNVIDNSPSTTSPVQSSVQLRSILVDTIQNEPNNQSSLNDSVVIPGNQKYQTSISHKLLLQNNFINIKKAPVYYLQSERKVKGKEVLFYSICILMLFLGLFRTFFQGYFNNLFRVFFNTSLRQSQLTDQLVQAKLPSLILNILFVLSAGLYAWLLFTHLSSQKVISPQILLPICMGAIAIIYLIKFFIIKFMGWVAGIQSTTNNYIFIIFLINKIIGILLIPFIILLAFSNPAWVGTITTVSFLLLGLFLLARYVKSYGSLDNKVRLNPFHFAVYVIGGEILPLLILYKVAVDYVLN